MRYEDGYTLGELVAKELYALHHSEGFGSGMGWKAKLQAIESVLGGHRSEADTVDYIEGMKPSDLVGYTMPGHPFVAQAVHEALAALKKDPTLSPWRSAPSHRQVRLLNPVGQHPALYDKTRLMNPDQMPLYGFSGTASDLVKINQSLHGTKFARHLMRESRAVATRDQVWLADVYAVLRRWHVDPPEWLHKYALD